MKFSSIIVTIFLILPAACNSQSTVDVVKQSPDPFAHCNFIAKSTGNHYLSVGKIFKPSCEVEINATGIENNILGGMRIVFRIARTDSFTDGAVGGGFKKTKAWVFTGYTFGNPPFNFKKIETSVKGSGADMTYIGRQTGSAASSKGVVYVFDGISIVRRSSAFVVYSRMAFEPNTSTALVDAVESELVKIVESVKVSDQSAVTNSPAH